jgi:hypothetical protein
LVSSRVLALPNGGLGMLTCTSTARSRECARWQTGCAGDLQTAKRPRVGWGLNPGPLKLYSRGGSRINLPPLETPGYASSCN